MSKSWTHLAAEAPDKSSAKHRQRVHINDLVGYTPVEELLKAEQA